MLQSVVWNHTLNLNVVYRTSSEQSPDDYADAKSTSAVGSRNLLRLNKLYQGTLVAPKGISFGHFRRK